MSFEIPREFWNVPEAMRLRELEAEFDEVCAREVAAVNARLWQTDLPAFTALETRSRELQMALKEAQEAFDLATGEPRPVQLPVMLVRAIDDQFAVPDRPTVAAKLAKTLAYLQRNQVNAVGVALAILKLAKGDANRVTQIADQALIDSRDIILSASVVK